MRLDRLRAPHLVLVLAAAVVCACGSPTDGGEPGDGASPGQGAGTPPPGQGAGAVPTVDSSRAAVLEHASGNFQEGVVGATLSVDAAVRVRDQAGRPRANVLVRWQTVGGRTSAAQGATDAAGIATTRWTLGTAAGVQSLRATADSLPPVGFTATARPGPAASVAITPATVTFGIVDDTAHFTVVVRDPYGNAIAGLPVAATSSDPRVVGVDALAGRDYLRAVDAGAAEITVSSGGVTGRVSTRVAAFASAAVGVGGTALCGTERVTDALLCWGANRFGTLGDGTRAPRRRPEPGARPAMRSVVAGELHMCGRAASGQGYCWGDDSNGQVGGGALPFAEPYVRATPLPIAGGLTFTALSAGRRHSCGLTPDGSAYCWGANFTGQLGRDTLLACGATVGRCTSAPLLVSDSLRFRSISAGPWEHSCGVTDSGDAYCWGSDAGSGRLGLGAAPPDQCGYPTPYSCSRAPRQVTGGVKFASVVAGGLHSCGLDGAGVAYCWGLGGSLGDGTPQNRPAPGPVSTAARFSTLVAGYGTTCGLTTAGELLCWGHALPPLPERRFPTRRFVALAAGDGGPCGILESGALVCERVDIQAAAR